ncbi:MAG TPA: hypothetical protein PK264_08425 [Hyphomicrobiaceae bacterium]|nr:hypothetical protein [Hyphomicrobiaceae bacterium]
MSSRITLASIVAATVASSLTAFVLSPATEVAADSATTSPSPPGCSCSESPSDMRRRLWPQPKLADARPSTTLEPTDELGALEAVNEALEETGDGSSYVWHGPNGRLSAVIQPTSSFRDRSGRICRHLHVLLNAGEVTRKAEGIACRSALGVWSLTG